MKRRKTKNGKDEGCNISAMSLRDYCAAQALPVVVAGNAIVCGGHKREDMVSAEAMAMLAYTYADAMIAARKQS